mmetsp:Transcript_98003/g.204430  ORF Transcript_98003/g.204430 Transcript_98003/m.204430 type:complete len:931 (-) Transcript_98003:198-2990(-)
MAPPPPRSFSERARSMSQERIRRRTSFDGLVRGTTPVQHEQADWVMAVARAIYRSRYIFVVGWLVITVCMAQQAWELVLRAAPMAKKPPTNTESSAAMAVFETHYANMATMRREMVMLKCKTECASAASPVSRGFFLEVIDELKRWNNTNNGTIVQIHSYFDFSGHHQLGENPMQTEDSQKILMQWIWRVHPDSESKARAEELCERIKQIIAEENHFQGANGFHMAATGLVFLDHAMKETLIEEIPVHEVSTIWLPFIILALALQSPRMLLLALLPMPIEIIVSFGIMYYVSLQTTVVLFALMMMLMLCTSLSFDYSLFTLTRYAEERSVGEDVENAILTVISQSGRVVVVSGCVLMIAWAAMLGLPSPFNGFCVAACSMILVCVLVQLTFVPSLLAVLPFLGPPRSKPLDALDDLGYRSPLKNGGSSPALSQQSAPELERARPHMKGLFFWSGGWITQFPLNVLLPIGVYMLFSPLTLRMNKNFDWGAFKFKMGHSYELTMPRTANEWDTLVEIQSSFPSEAGIVMPLMIMLERTDQTGETLNKQEFFDMNCRMANAVIAQVKGQPWQVTADNFVSATFHGSDVTGKVSCMETWQMNLVRNNWAAKNIFLAHTSEHLQELWSQLMSPQGDAMLTFLFPPMDPFSPNAFDLVREVRKALARQTAEENSKGGAPIRFLTFSPGSVLMDLIDVTSGQLPVCFIGCAIVCLTLIAIWFGSVFIPFKLLLTVVVPITWTYGAGLYVYEDGVLDWIGIAGVHRTGDAGLDWTVPMFTLTFMMGLALDYEIFLFERVREFREEGFGECESIQLGLAATGGTISSAGLIMALTFVAQMLGSIPVTNQMGFILVFSIVVDTFVVRSILVPAMLSLIPCANYWPAHMPKPRFEWLGDFKTSPFEEEEGDQNDEDGDGKFDRDAVALKVGLEDGDDADME